VITKTERIRKVSIGNVLKNAAGAAATAAVQAVTGDRDLEAGTTLGGAGVGALLLVYS